MSGIIKKRPSIKLRCPAELHAGEEFVASIEIIAAKPVPARALTVTLEGDELGGIGSGKHRSVARAELVRLQASPRVAQVLEGRSEYACRFTLPAGLPPSFDGNDAHVRYRMRVRVDIPWWPDAKQTYELMVVPATVVADDGPPVRFTSKTGGPQGKESYLEGSLQAAVIAPNEVLAGAVALGNVAEHRYQVVRVSLVGTQTVKIRRRTRDTEVHRYQVALPAAELDEGQMVPFELRVPPVVPAFASGIVRLDWALEVHAVIRLGFDLKVSIPISVVPASKARAARARPRLAPPSIGSSRLNEIWTAVAREFAISLEGERLVGAGFEIRRDYRGAGGTFLVASLRYPSLELGLHIVESGMLGLFTRRRVTLGLSAWDTEHTAEGRDPDQCNGFLRSIRSPLAALDVPALDDESATVERKDAGRDAAKLRAFVRDVLGLAQALGPARPEIPPPTVMAGGLIEWRALAVELGGTLRTATMSVVGGSVRGVPVEVRTEWFAAFPARTVLAVRPLHRLMLPTPVRLTRDDAGVIDDGADALPEPVQARLAALFDGARELTASEQGVELALAAPHLPALTLAPRLSDMVTLAGELREGAGVYR